MTKAEFIQRAVIAMAGNPSVVNSAIDTSTYDVVALAIHLANECEERFSQGFFDNPSTLSGIRDALNEIRDYIGAPGGCGNLSTLQEMVYQIDKIREHLIKRL